MVFFDKSIYTLNLKDRAAWQILIDDLFRIYHGCGQCLVSEHVEYDHKQMSQFILMDCLFYLKIKIKLLLN